MKIARIVSSNSHIDYVGRVIGKLESAETPQAEDHGFGQFVTARVNNEIELVGVVYDSRLVNPDYADYGPRLSSAKDLTTFSADVLDEQGTLIGILLLGWRDTKSGARGQGVPKWTIPAHQEVEKMNEEAVTEFHRVNDEIQLHYYSQVIAHAGTLGIPLLENILTQLEAGCSDEDKNRLNVLKQSLNWQRTVGGMRL
jgi:hypothetical protein